MSSSRQYPVTPDGCYFVVDGRLWRTSKRALGERGPVWWTDGAPDLNRRMVANTPYADWYAALAIGPEGRPDALR